MGHVSMCVSMAPSFVSAMRAGKYVLLPLIHLHLAHTNLSKGMFFAPVTRKGPLSPEEVSFLGFTNHPRSSSSPLSTSTFADTFEGSNSVVSVISDFCDESYKEVRKKRKK